MGVLDTLVGAFTAQLLAGFALAVCAHVSLFISARGTTYALVSSAPSYMAFLFQSAKKTLLPEIRAQTASGTSAPWHASRTAAM